MKSVAVLLGPGWADWEASPLLGAAGYFLQLPVTIAAPDPGPIRSAGGLTASADLTFAELQPSAHSAIALIGGPLWLAPPDGVDALIRASVEAAVPVGGICAGTAALARVGLLDDRAHTSNGVGYLDGLVPGYRGADRYCDVPHAVADRGVVTAPGTAPMTFAVGLLALAAPGSDELLGQLLTQSSREFR